MDNVTSGLMSSAVKSPRDVNVSAIKINKLNEVAIFHYNGASPYFYGYRKGCPTFIVAGTVITGTCFFAVSAGPVDAVFI